MDISFKYIIVLSCKIHVKFKKVYVFFSFPFKWCKKCSKFFEKTFKKGVTMFVSQQILTANPNRFSQLKKK